VTRVQDQNDEPLSLVLFRNFADRKRMASALQESEARYRAALSDQTETIARCRLSFDGATVVLWQERGRFAIERMFHSSPVKFLLTAVSPL